MFSDPIAVTYNAVSKDLVRGADDKQGVDYFLDDGTEKFELLIRHTVPNNPGDPGEQHHIRLNVQHFDGDGVYLRTSSAWATVKSVDGAQVTADDKHAITALEGLLTSGNIDKLLAREA